MKRVFSPEKVHCPCCRSRLAVNLKASTATQSVGAFCPVCRSLVSLQWTVEGVLTCMTTTPEAKASGLRFHCCRCSRRLPISLFAGNGGFVGNVYCEGCKSVISVQSGLEKGRGIVTVLRAEGWRFA